ncbi:hypothetical protein AB0G15_05805 [Streptosporangium sp. NPDC023825]|uniref:hypothetical protein n=1 Tax=Streptosporangium sp. NPDC023825 TaxID=3154909 RepID=UPI0034166EF4
MAEDGIRIMFEWEGKELSKVVDNPRDEDGQRYTWSLLLATNLHGTNITVEHTGSVSNGMTRPDVKDVFAALVSKATGIISSENFPDWARQCYEVDIHRFRSESDMWDHVDKAWKVYNENLAMIEKLRLFLGGKFDDYMHETDFDI